MTKSDQAARTAVVRALSPGYRSVSEVMRTTRLARPAVQAVLDELVRQGRVARRIEYDSVGVKATWCVVEPRREAVEPAASEG